MFGRSQRRVVVEQRGVPHRERQQEIQEVPEGNLRKRGLR